MQTIPFPLSVKSNAVWCLSFENVPLKKKRLRAVKFLSINQESTFLRNKSCYMHTTWNLFLRNFLHPGCFTHGMETYCNFTTTSLKMSSTRFSVKLVVAGCPSFRSRSDSVIKKDFKLKISFHVSVSFNLINWTMLFAKLHIPTGLDNEI